MTLMPTITVRRLKEPWRKQPWGVFWRARGKKKSAFFVTQDEANQFRNDLVAGLTNTPPPEQPTATTKGGTVAAYFTHWLDVHIKPKRDAATYRSYEQLQRIHIVPAPMKDGTTFGELPMADLRPVVLLRLYEDLFDRKVALGTRRLIHATLSSACGYAVIDEVIDRNPCLTLARQLRHTGEADVDADPNPFTKTEARAFLAYIHKHEPAWEPYFTFLHDTGVRVGESAALKWDQVELDMKRARIAFSYSPSAGKDIDTKTHQDRWIDLSDRVIDHLTTWRPQQRVETLKIGRPTKYVLTNRRGSPRRQDGNMRRVFDRAMAWLADAEIKTTKATGQTAADITTRWTAHTPHNIRDTFATLHLSSDFRKLPWVSKQLGHESERTTVDHYFKFLPSAFSKAYANQIR